MFRRIFGIGGKKRKPRSDLHGSAAAVTLEELAAGSEPTGGGSVVPLHSSPMAVKKKKDSAEIFNDAVTKLVDNLEGIKNNLDRQVQQNQQLVQRMDVLPEMLSTMPKAVEEQRQAFARVAEQLAQKVQRDEKVAEELAGIHEKVAASTEIDAQMSENFSAFSETLGKLDQDTVCQTEWLQQISHTFLTSERYMKHTLAKQQIRFYWVFGISLGVCFFAVVALIIGIALLMNG